MDKKIYLRGQINNEGNIGGDADDCLAIYTGEENIVFAQFFEENFENKQVSVNYYISDRPLSREQLTEQYIKKIMGISLSLCYPVYSDVTGYLWAEEECTVGGHNLLKELYDNLDKYIDMEITVHEESEEKDVID